MNAVIDYLKRRILFWKYEKISIDLTIEGFKKLKDMATKEKKTIDQFVENILKHYII